MYVISKKGEKMYQERRKENWTQTLRRENLARVEKYIAEAGGYSEVLSDMRDFQRYVARELGCSIKTVREYIDTVRGAAIFKGKMLESGGEKE